LIVAQGTTNELKRDLQAYSRFQLELAEWTPAFVERLRATDGVIDVQAESRQGRTEVRLALSREELIASTMATLNEAGGRVLTLRRIEPTLEEAFVRLVGDAAEDEQKEETL
jgi:ABC-2 type transport system ATP-binding protein